jgi:hypothetical protein
MLPVSGGNIPDFEAIRFPKTFASAIYATLANYNLQHDD